MKKAVRVRQLRRRISFFTAGVLVAASITFANRVDADGDTYISSEYVRYCEQIGDDYCICPEVLEALIETESGGNASAISSHGAVGLCQIIPKYSKYSKKELLDPYTNIKACAEIITDLSESYDLKDTLIAYNCGEYSATFKKYKGTSEMTKYSKKIIERAYELEEVHGKH